MYLKEFYCNKLVSLTVDEGLKAFNFHVYEEEADLDDVFADAEILPVMCERTCLLVKNYPLTNLGSEQRITFETQLRELPDTTILIFYYGSMEVTYNRKTSAKWCDIIDIFQKYGAVAELLHRTPAKIAKMLIKAAPDRGAEIGEAEAEYFISVAGDDTQVLFNEFNKLCAFADGRKITKAMIDSTTVKTVEASVFDISEAIFQRRPDDAFAIVQELLRRKTPPQPILGALAGAYVNLYRYQTAKNAGKNINDMAEAMGYKGNSAYALKKMAPFALKISPAAVIESLSILLDADVKSKSVAIDPTLLLTDVIARLSAAAQKE